jgi:hypothetical protein
MGPDIWEHSFGYFIQRLVFYETRHFRNWTYSCPQIKAWEAPTVFCPLRLISITDNHQYNYTCKTTVFVTDMYEEIFTKT